jgi:hypothetical protein
LLLELEVEVEVLMVLIIPLLMVQVAEQQGELQFVYIPLQNLLQQHILLVVGELQELMLEELVELVGTQHLQLLVVEQV